MKARHGGSLPPVEATDSERCEPAGDERAALVALLRSHGAADAQIDAASSTGELIRLATDVVLEGGRVLSAGDLAERARLPVDQIVHLWNTLGVDVPDVQTAMFSEADAAFLSAMTEVDFFTRAESDELLRVVGSALARVADAAVSFYIQTVESGLAERGAGLALHAEKNLGATAKALELGSGLPAAFSHHLSQAVSRQRVAQAEVTDRALFRVAVGFVDLVGFTPISHRMSTRELSTFVSRFERQAFDVATKGGGRIVKHIGDEVMFVALDPIAACHVALALMDSFADERIQPRGGVAFGDVVTRQGDYYGEVVNLASRLADVAVPGEVLVDERLAEAIAGGDLAWDEAGRRQLKGFDEPVRVRSLVRTATPG